MIDGNIILNNVDKFFNFLYDQAKKKGINVISFGSKRKADIFLLRTRRIKNHYRLKVVVKKRIFYFDTTHSTNNFINNILAWISVLSVLNLDLNDIKKKFTNFAIPSGRGDGKVVKKIKKRFKFIDESYKANPLSMYSAIKNMDYYKRKKKAKKLVLLGDMLELGKKSKKLHKE